jgi:apolipoprotein N-acyltransferase
VALAWVVQEALRDRVPYGGFPWVRLAFSQADSPLGRLAALAGAPLVTFAVALAGGLLAAVAWDLALGWRRGVEHGPRRPRALLGLIGLTIVVGVGFAVPLPTDGTPANVMAVQGNVPRPGLDFNAERRQVLDNHVTATEDAAAEVAAGTRPRPDLVVWPENSSDLDPTRNDDAAVQITRAVDAVDAPLVVGTLLEQPAPDISNVALLYEPGKGIVDTYVKQHPVPFAEYIPSRDFFRRFSDKVDLVRADFAAGTGPVLFRVPAASGGEVVAGPTICFEVAYDDLVRANVDLGANLLLVETNNATFGYSDESVQQLAISRIRAMEHGRSVVHVSTVGVSALITPDGTAHQPSALFTRTVLSGSLPLRNVRTVASVVGPWPEYAGCLAFPVVLLAGLRRRPSAEPATRRPQPSPRTKEPHRG